MTTEPPPALQLADRLLLLLSKALDHYDPDLLDFPDWISREFAAISMEHAHLHGQMELPLDAEPTE